MKKIYFLASVLLATFTVQAQTTVDFEEWNLDSTGYYNGNDGSGNFSSGGAIFGNHYNTEWDYLETGFTISNHTDATTPGFMNQYSAITAGGANGSSNYAVNFGGDTLFLPENYYAPQSVQITNTTYTYLSMRDGDDFGKKFGENGDKDYFYININGFDGENNLINTVTFYLADFRSDNADDHYIVNTWETVDLTPLYSSHFLTFDYFSSDTSEYGINTPAYFAMDDFTYNVLVSSVEKQEKESFRIYPNPAENFISINGKNGSYSIYSVNGSKILDFPHNGIEKIDVSTLNSGIYFIKTDAPNSSVEKLIVR